jgi:NhaA family Na+:H+ antiporter
MTVAAPVPARERRWLLHALHDETTGGLLLIAATIVAVVWANSQWAESYQAVTGYEVGPAGLRLTVAHWAADLLLAVFFFVAGTELKHEFSGGSLATPRTAIVPISAALGGMAAAAGIFLVFTRGTALTSAWAIPISTDVAFALAVLAVFGRRLPLELRSFLLTLAVVNDLAAITVIAVFYGSGVNLAELAGALTAVAVFAWLQYRAVRGSWLYLMLAAVTWYLMYRSGVHPTVAGVMLGLAMRVTARPNERQAPIQRAHEVMRPLSAGVCVPLFALVSAGVAVPVSQLGGALQEPLLLGIVIGLVVGQPIGVTVGAYLAARLARTPLNPALSWWDVLVVGTLAGIGFTVALLVSQVSFTTTPQVLNIAKLSIVVANVCAIVVAVLAMSLRTAILGRYRE